MTETLTQEGEAQQRGAQPQQTQVFQDSAPPTREEIETRRLADSRELAAELKVHIQEGREALKKLLPRRFIFDIETTGLSPIERDPITNDPLTNKIVCISLYDVDLDLLDTFVGPDEREILRQFWKKIDSAVELIGFNIEFDLEFIAIKSFLHGLKVTDTFGVLRKIDLRYTINPWNERPVGRLRDYACLLGMPFNSSPGGLIPILYRGGDWDEIKKHCEEDIQLTLMLYKRCKECGLL